VKHYDLHTVCHLGGRSHSLALAALRLSEAGEALIRSVGNGRGLRSCRVRDKTRWGPSGRNLKITHKVRKEFTLQS